MNSVENISLLRDISRRSRLSGGISKFYRISRLNRPGFAGVLPRGCVGAPFIERFGDKLADVAHLNP